MAEPRRGGEEERRGERGGSRGQSLFLFGSLGSLGETWRENGCIRAGVGGVKILILLKNSWFEFFLTSPPPHLPEPPPTNPHSSLQIQGDEKFVERGTSKIKRGFTVQSRLPPCPAPALARNAVTSALGLAGDFDLKQGSGVRLCFQPEETSLKSLKIEREITLTFIFCP